MGVIFTNGFGVGTVSNNIVTDIFWNPSYTSNGLTIYPSITGYSYWNKTFYKSSITDNQPGAYSALGKVSIGANGKKMFSFVLDGDAETNAENYWLGIGNISTNLNDSIGVDANSYGICNTGTVFFQNSPIVDQLPTFGNIGDIIDVAVHDGHKMWYRVNGGEWNGSNAGNNPATNTGGIDISALSGQSMYPAIAILGLGGPSLFSVLSSAIYGLPSGYSLIAGDNPGHIFTILANQLTNPWSVCNNNNGIYDSNTQALVINQAANNVYCGMGATLSEFTDIERVFIDLGIINNGGIGLICEVTWAAGSTVINGYAKINYETFSKQVVINTIDPSDPDSMNNDANANTGTQLAGTFKFPATFKVMLPLDNKGGWC